MDVAARIADAAPSLTRSERRIAEVVIASPQLVAFGTVAQLADAAGTGAATVVRLAGKLSFDGFTGLQAAVQADLARQLRPAAERILQPVADDLVAEHRRVEMDNVDSTLAGVSADTLADAVSLLSAADRNVVVVSGDASTGVAWQMVAELQSMRDGVELSTGNEIQVLRRIAVLRPGDVVVAIDLRRYDRWVVDATARAQARGAEVIAVTDSLLSPLCVDARCRFVVSALGGGPFDSHVGTLALLNLLVGSTAVALRDGAADRLGAAEAVWQETGALTDG